MTLSLSAVRRAGPSRRSPAGIARYLSVWKQRRELAALDATRLLDMGISPAQAAAEIMRPFWDLP